MLLGGGAMWIDLQETFYFVLAPFIFYLLLWILVGGGVVLAIVMAVLKVFRR